MEGDGVGYSLGLIRGHVRNVREGECRVLGFIYKMWSSWTNAEGTDCYGGLAAARDFLISSILLAKNCVVVHEGV